MKSPKWSSKLKQSLAQGLWVGVFFLGLSGAGCSAETDQTLTDALTSATTTILEAAVNSLVTSATSTQ